MFLTEMFDLISFAACCLSLSPLRAPNAGLEWLPLFLVVELFLNRFSNDPPQVSFVLIFFWNTLLPGVSVKLTQSCIFEIGALYTFDLAESKKLLMIGLGIKWKLFLMFPTKFITPPHAAVFGASKFADSDFSSDLGSGDPRLILWYFIEPNGLLSFTFSLWFVFTLSRQNPDFCFAGFQLRYLECIPVFLSLISFSFFKE
mmetsp:Transcript_16541/g.19126  ORF Transcript_16541/g.19126 Transcript_16541/m.19126 type:complete len:201 (-) Transcript_16541:94-696(-)